jgi:hypothetical protein
MLPGAQLFRQAENQSRELIESRLKVLISWEPRLLLRFPGNAPDCIRHITRRT